MAASPDFGIAGVCPTALWIRARNIPRGARDAPPATDMVASIAAPCTAATARHQSTTKPAMVAGPGISWAGMTGFADALTDGRVPLFPTSLTKLIQGSPDILDLALARGMRELAAGRDSEVVQEQVPVPI
jgi:hypothetical protein